MSTIITKKQFNNHIYETEIAGRPFSLEFGKVAELANASALVRYGETTVLVAVTVSPRPQNIEMCIRDSHHIVHRLGQGTPGVLDLFGVVPHGHPVAHADDDPGGEGRLGGVPVSYTHLDVYKRQVVGETPKSEDITVNVCRKKQLTNMRASGSDEALRLVPPRNLSLEQCLEFLADDELLEVTPKTLRLRKRILNHEIRMKALKGNKKYQNLGEKDAPEPKSSGALLFLGFGSVKPFLKGR